MKVRLAWVASLVVACSSPSLAGDKSILAPVVDLGACDVDGTTVRLSWTCVAVDGHAASAYDIRTSATPILTEANFAAATALAGGPTPGLPGTVQTFDVTVSAGQCAWFAMKVSDGVGAWSGLSNSGNGCAVDAVTDLSMIAGTHMMLVNWTAMGCTQAIGVPTAYDLRYSPSSINAINWGSCRTVATDTPLAPGKGECAQVFDLLNNTTYYFAIKVGDAQGHWTGLSNLPSKRTRITGDFVYDCPPATTSVDGDPSTTLRLTVSRAELGSSELGFTLLCPAELAGQPARLRVLDVGGRTVGEWSSIGMAGTEAVVVPVRAGAIHAGVYFAHLTVGSRRVDRSVVVTR